MGFIGVSKTTTQLALYSSLASAVRTKRWSRYVQSKRERPYAEFRLGQYSAVGGENIHLLPDNIPLDIGALVEPL